MAAHLLVAAGGGGDALAALLLRQAAGRDDGPAVVASFSWDRYLMDPTPGPRAPGDFRHLRQVAPHCWEVTHQSRLISGGWSTLSLLAQYTSARFVLLDPRAGARGLRVQLGELVKEFAVQTVALVDVGGDVLARGNEPSLLSPLADSLALSAVAGLDVPTDVVVAGAGLDGELPSSEVRARCVELGSRCTSLSSACVLQYAQVLRRHPSEATALLAAAALDVRGTAEIRDSASLVTLDSESADVHIIDHDVVFSGSSIASRISVADSLDDAEKIVIEMCGKSELDHERRKARRTAPSAGVEDLNQVRVRYRRYRGEACSRGVSLVTFRRLSEVVGLGAYDPARVRDLVGADAHSLLPLCQIGREEKESA